MFHVKHFRPRLANQTRLNAERRQALVGVVRTQGQAVLRPRSEHTIGLGDAAGDEVVDQDADISFRPVDQDWLLASELGRSIGARHQALRCRLFIACSAVDLPSEIKARETLGLQRWQQFTRIHIVILNGVAVTDDLCVLEARDGFEEMLLHLLRQRSRNPIGIDRVGFEALRLQKDLMAVAFGEADHLVLNRRAVARAPARDRAAVDGRRAEILLNDLVGRRRGLGHAAGDLRDRDFGIHKGERNRRSVRRLHVEARPINGSPIKPGGRSGLQPVHPEPGAIEPVGQAHCGSLDAITFSPARRDALIADMDDALEEGPRGQDHRPRPDFSSVCADNPGYRCST